jgi:RNA polymerase sigma-70 factor, ECF subfamily
MQAAEDRQFETYRPLLFAIAYRMLGSASDAEDIVQDAYLRYQAMPPDQIVAPKAFLSTVVTRLCLNQLQAARTQRETYIGPWLPEPLLTESPGADRAELHESISLAFLVLLEQLTPVERAVFLLREVFDYGYGEIAEILGKEEAACRQVFHRARQHLSAQRPRFTTTPEAHRQILAQFLRAVGSGDLEGLVHLLADDVVLWADGGGKVRGAATRPVGGATAVARFILASPRFTSDPLQGEVVEVNGAPAIILRAGDEARFVVAASIDGGRIKTIHLIGNPDKLRRLNQKEH